MQNQDSGILGQGSTFFVREILDGICTKPRGDSVGCLRPKNMLQMEFLNIYM